MTSLTDPLISLIVAVANNGVIGNKGALPWRIPEDMRWFRMHTLGKPVIMGRKTWESLPTKPLPKRENIIVTHDSGYVAREASVATSFDAALAAAAGSPEIVVIGGASLYAEALPRAGRIYLTSVGLKPEGDVFMPEFSPDDWKQTFVQSHPALGPLPGFTFRILERANPA